MGLFSGLHWEWNFFLLWNFQGIKYYFYMDFFVLLTIKKNMCMSNTVFEVLHMKMSCCCCSVTMSCLTLCNCNMPCFPVLHCLLEFAQTHVHWVVDAIQSSHPLSSSSPPVLSLSQHQGLFQWVGCLHRWPKYWGFCFSISPSNEYSGLISLRMDWLDLLAVQGTLKSLLQHNSSKPSILWCWAFFMVQLSYPYMTTGKTIALTLWTFVGKVMSLLFNTPSRLIVAFIPRSKHL